MAGIGTGAFPEGVDMQRTRITRRGGLAALVAASLGAATAFLGAGSSGALADSSVTTLTGSFKDGATYLIQVPPQWNGTLVLYSHGYVVPGGANPAVDVGDPLTGQWLLTNGYALAGSSYASTGWAIQQAIPDQLATVNTFTRLVGKPRRTIAWGHSLGGMITAGSCRLRRSDYAALPMCGVVAGGVGTWNEALDSAFAVQQLLDPALQVVNITDPSANLGAAEGAFAAAQSTPQGQARIALASALGDIPGWFTTGSPEPRTDRLHRAGSEPVPVGDRGGRALRLCVPSRTGGARAGGNASWTRGVNFTKQLALSADSAEVQALYAAAGLSLSSDLATLQGATQISANPSSVAYLTQNIVYNGQLGRPVLTMHTTGDGLVVNEDEQAYKAAVNGAGDEHRLRQVFVSRAGHCASRRRRRSLLSRHSSIGLTPVGGETRPRPASSRPLPLRSDRPTTAAPGLRGLHPHEIPAPVRPRLALTRRARSIGGGASDRPPLLGDPARPPPGAQIGGRFSASRSSSQSLTRSL